MVEPIIIVAMTQDFGIGKDGQLPWPMIREDMKHFAEITAKKPVLMGRKTWESIPEKFRPLKGRWNLIVTSNPHGVTVPNLAMEHDKEIRPVCPDLVTTSWNPDVLFEQVTNSNHDECYIIGGGSIYRHFYPKCKKMWVTWINGQYACDTFFPPVLENEWNTVQEKPLNDQCRAVLLERKKLN